MVPDSGALTATSIYKGRKSVTIAIRGGPACPYLVRFNGGKLLVLLDEVADALGKLLESTLGYRFSHRRDGHHLVGVGPNGLHHGREHDHRVVLQAMGAQRHHARSGNEPS